MYEENEQVFTKLVEDDYGKFDGGRRIKIPMSVERVSCSYGTSLIQESLDIETSHA